MLTCSNMVLGKDPFPSRAAWRWGRRPFVQYRSMRTGEMAGCLFTSPRELQRWDNRSPWDGERRFSASNYEEVARGWVTFKTPSRRG